MSTDDDINFITNNNGHNKPASSSEDDDSLRMMAFGGSEKGDETDSVKDMNEMLNSTNYYGRGTSVSSNDRLEGEDILIFSQSTEAPGNGTITDSGCDNGESSNTPKASNAAREVDPSLLIPQNDQMSQQVVVQPQMPLSSSEHPTLDGSRTRSDSSGINDQPTEQRRGRFKIQPTSQSPLVMPRDLSRSKSPPTRLPETKQISPKSLPIDHPEVGMKPTSDRSPTQSTINEDADVKVPVTQRYPLQSTQHVATMQHQVAPQLSEVAPISTIQQQQQQQLPSQQMATRVDTPVLTQTVPQAMTPQAPVVQHSKQEVPPSNSIVGDNSGASFPPPTIPALVHPSQTPASSASTTVQPTVVGMVGNTPIVAIPETSVPQTFSKKKGRFKLLPATAVQTPGTPTGVQQTKERSIPERSVSLGAVSQNVPVQPVEGSMAPVIQKKGRFVVTNVSPNVPMQTVMTTAQPILPIDPKVAALQASARAIPPATQTVLPTHPTVTMQAPIPANLTTPAPVSTQPVFSSSIPVAAPITQQPVAPVLVNTPVDQTPASVTMQPIYPVEKTTTASMPIAAQMIQQPVVPVEQMSASLQAPVLLQAQLDNNIATANLRIPNAATVQNFQTNSSILPGSPVVISQAPPSLPVAQMADASSQPLPQQPVFSSQRTSPVPAHFVKHASEPNSPASFQPYGGRPPPAFTSAPPDDLVRLKASASEKIKAPNQQQRPTKPAPRHIAPGFAGQQQGMGKIFYFLDQMRAEVQEADRTIKSLQTDMKCMKEKNKELEAKARDMERKYNQEKALREVAETRLKALKKKYRAMKGESNDIGGPKEDDSVVSNQTGGRHSRANSLDGGMELPNIASTSGNASVTNSESSKTATLEAGLHALMNANSRNATPEKKVSQMSATYDEPAKPKALIVERSSNQDISATNFHPNITITDDSATARVKSLPNEQTSTSPHRDASIWQTSGAHSSGQKPPAIPPVLPSKSNASLTQNIKSGVIPPPTKNAPASTSAFSMTHVRQLSATTGGTLNDMMRTDFDIHKVSGNNPSLSSVSCSSNDSPDVMQSNQLGLHSRNDSGCSVHSTMRSPNTANFDPLATPTQQNIFEAGAVVPDDVATGLKSTDGSRPVQNQQRNVIDSHTSSDINNANLLNLQMDIPTIPNQATQTSIQQVSVQAAANDDGISVDAPQQPQLTSQPIPIPATSSHHQQQQHQQWISQQRPPQPDLLSSPQDALNCLLSTTKISQQTSDPFDELVQTRQSSQKSQSPL